MSDPRLSIRSIGPYIVETELGRGGVSVVYRGRHQTSGQLAAVKVLSVFAAREPVLVQRLLAEAHAVRSLAHPNIVRLLADGRIPPPDHRPYLAFEYLDGMSLAEVIRALGPLDIATVVQIVADVARGLQAAHDQRLVHRDIKPANIFLARIPAGGARIVILDFGIAKWLGANADLTQSGVAMGTPRYMAPEQVRDASSVDGRADVYALATVALELLTGDPPGNPASLRRINEELETTCRFAMSHRPDRRCSSVTLFAGLLASVCRLRDHELIDVGRLERLLASARKARLERALAEATIPLPEPPCVPVQPQSVSRDRPSTSPSSSRSRTRTPARGIAIDAIELVLRELGASDDT